MQRIFHSNIYIEDLNLSQTNISGQNCADLCRIVGDNNDRLRVLKINGCGGIGDLGGVAVAKLLGIKGKKLVEVEVVQCGIGEEGGLAISESLKTNFCI